ncbi:MAG: alginate export family protein [Candidatus Omnitrophota bacterium]
MKKLLLAVLVVALVAMPAFASVQNVKVSGSINSTYLNRDQFDFGSTAGQVGWEQSLLLTQSTLRVDADLTDNVSTTVKLLNERVWGESDVSSPDDANDIDINLAYATMREMLYSPLTVVIGRQELFYGNGLVIGNGTNNVTGQGGLNGVAEDLAMNTAFDAVKLILNYDPLTIDVVASKVDSNVSLGAGEIKDDVNLFGTNANYKLGDSKNTEVEAYFWTRVDNSTAAAAAGSKADTVYNPGLRASTNPIKGLNVQGEVAWQRGNKAETVAGGVRDNQQREAMAAQVIASYAVSHDSVAKWNPVLSSWFTYLSGDNDGMTASLNPSTKETYTAWDPMFEGQAGGTIYNTLFDYSNVRLVGGSLQVNPMQDVTLKGTVTGLWLDKDLDQISTGDGNGSAASVLRQPDGTFSTLNVTSNRHLGNEFDVALMYDYTEDVQLGLNAGWFFPGAVFVNAYGHNGLDDNHQMASQLIANVNVNF